LLLLDGEGLTVGTYPLEAPPVAIGLGALAETAYAALADGRVMAIRVSS
jgi:hypothetical protein